MLSVLAPAPALPPHQPLQNFLLPLAVRCGLFAGNFYLAFYNGYYNLLNISISRLIIIFKKSKHFFKFSKNFKRIITRIFLG